MHQGTKVRRVAGLAGVITGVALIGTSGAVFVTGWVVWAVGLGVLLTAMPSAGGGERRRPDASFRRRGEQVLPQG